MSLTHNKKKNHAIQPNVIRMIVFIWMILYEMYSHLLDLKPISWLFTGFFPPYLLYDHDYAVKNIQFTRGLQSLIKQ